MMLSWLEGSPLGVTSILLVLLAVSYGLGVLLGRRRPEQAQHPSAARITDSTLALMGLLLAFTFAMALSKFDRRREMVVADSNSIGDFYTCVCMLKDSPQREQLRQVAREYVTHRLEIARGGLPDAAAWHDAQERVAAMQGRMTDLVRQVVQEGTPVSTPLVNTLNGLTSAHASRVVAARDRLPAPIVALLFLATALSLGMLGWQHGGSGGTIRASSILLLILVAAAVYLTLDLNQAHRGLIRVNQEPLQWLLRSMGPG